MSLKCFDWCFHLLSNSSNWWGWEKNFQSTWVSWIIFQMICSFWIFLCIFMFLPSDFNVSYSLTYVWLLARTNTFVNHTWWMGISTVQFKQLFNFLSDPLNTNIVFIISKNIKLRNIWKILHFWDSMVYPPIQPSMEYQKNQEEWCSRQFHPICLESY